MFPSAGSVQVTTDYRYIPFSGGPRKCVGDQFALLEAVAALGSLLRRFDFALVPNQVPARPCSISAERSICLSVPALVAGGRFTLVILWASAAAHGTPL